MTVGYLEQERACDPGESVLETLARRAGDRGMRSASSRSPQASSRKGSRRTIATPRRSSASSRLGGADFHARARSVCAELGLALDLERERHGLSGGESARVALASILLSRFDLLLLDEPTNDLDFDGLERLERFLDSYRGALVVVSHDRAFLDRTVDRIAAIEPGSHRLREWAGGWSEYAAARDAERAAALRPFRARRSFGAGA